MKEYALLLGVGAAAAVVLWRLSTRGVRAVAEAVEDLPENLERTGGAVLSGLGIPTRGNPILLDYDGGEGTPHWIARALVDGQLDDPSEKNGTGQVYGKILSIESEARGTVVKLGAFYWEPEWESDAVPDRRTVTLTLETDEVFRKTIQVGAERWQTFTIRIVASPVSVFRLWFDNRLVDSR